jgi:hypothetical protein
MKKIVIRADELDNGSVVVNFDMLEGDVFTKQSGYMMVEVDKGCFVTTIFNSSGHVDQKIVTMFDFKKVEDV